MKYSETPVIKVIDGRRYNTATATEVASYENDCFQGDCYHLSETLFMTPKGNYFIAGFGGAFSKYARRVDQHARIGGDGLEPMTFQEAFAWAEEHCQTALTSHEPFALMVVEA
tara:strand:- start:206 stop:544 length:339 start_codon:yes stop_codon:yes gene_type:complete